MDRRLSSKVINVFSGVAIGLLARASKSGLIVCVSSSPNDNLVKIYDVDKLDKDQKPTLVRTTRLSQSGYPTALALDENQNLVAVGFANGTLILIRGDLRRDRGAKQRALLSGKNLQVSISGLAFRSAKLYVTTTEEVFLFNVSVKDRETCTRLDDIGCQVGLAVATEGLEEAHLAIARKDAIYFYSAEGRGQCHAIEGEKCNIFWFRTYLVVVTKETPSWSNKSADLHRGREDKHILTIFDIQNKFIAYSAPVKSINFLAAEWGLLYGLADGDTKLFHLVEKDIQSKLDLLFKKNFYDIAIKIAKSHHYDTEGLVDIFRQYGNHLYSKGDNAAAIENYIKTIGYLEPSYVIRKFLDAHKINFLTAYLQALHAKGLANEDHTTLLLNCYTKLKDKAKLDEFILKDRQNVDFDVAVAIKVCRQANYNDHALILAKTHDFSDLYLEIQLEDQKNYAEGLVYIKTMKNCRKSMLKYGAILMKHLPTETTEFLKKICVEDQSTNPDEFLSLFIRNNEGLLDFLEHVIEQRPDCSEAIYNDLLEHYLHHFNTMEETDQSVVKAMEDKILHILSSPKLSYDNDQALVLCQLHNFLRGTLHLYERKGLHSQILKLHVEMNNVEAALQTCRQFGPQNPSLWVEALQLIGDVDNQAAKDIHVEEILNTIEEQSLMSPLLVVRTLAGSPMASLGIVRRYLLNVYQTEEKQIEEHARVIEQYRVDTQKVQDRIHELKSSALTLQQSKCSACNQSLDLPALHFLCGHSYHKHCFQSYSDSDDCPACLLDNKKILDIVKSQQQSREQHDSFHSQLEKADDGFAVVAEYFGRGMFRKEIDLDTLDPISSVPAKETKVVNKAPSSSAAKPVVTTPKPVVVKERSPVVAKRQAESLNPFGTPEESPEKEVAGSNNPFGDPDEYDEGMNPFADD